MDEIDNQVRKLKRINVYYHKEKDIENFKERKTTDTVSSNNSGYTDLENLTRGRFDK